MSKINKETIKAIILKEILKVAHIRIVVPILYKFNPTSFEMDQLRGATVRSIQIDAGI